MALPDFFDKKGKFIPKWLVDYITLTKIFKTVAGEIFVYDSGVYRRRGKEVIESLVNACLDVDFRKNHCSETVFYIQTSSYIDPVKNSVPKNLINVRNGLYNLDKNSLESHNPDIFSLSQLPVIYDKNADCPTIKKFISEIVKKEDIENLQEFAGYCLWRDYHIQKAFMLIGDGENGKSTFLTLLKTFLGIENTATISLQEMASDRFATADLFGKLANIYADLPNSALKNTGIFKMLTGGDIISAQWKFKDRFKFINHAKLIFSTNEMPESKDTTHAFFRRWIIIDFPNRFDGAKCDKKIIDKLTTSEELSGMLNWALEGLKRLQQNSHFSNEKSTEETREKYESESSSVKSFATNYIEFSSTDRIIKTMLYNEYLKYCKENSLPSVAENSFGRKLKETINIQNTKIGKKPAWAGIKLKKSVKLVEKLLKEEDLKL